MIFSRVHMFLFPIFLILVKSEQEGDEEDKDVYLLVKINSNKNGQFNIKSTKNLQV